MLSFEQMLFRLVIALVLGGILGVERELVGKEAGVRTEMLVAGGAAIFAMIGLTLPYITAAMMGSLPDMNTMNAGLSVIANIVVGIGFLGGGLIIKTSNHAHGVTTAALVWASSAIGILAGIGLTMFAVSSTILLVFLLYILRKMGIADRLEPKKQRS